MAIIKMGPTIVGVRGTIGGVTFSENKGGPYAKIWNRPSNPLQPKQTAHRAVLATMPSLWRALSPAQQTAWDVFADLPAQERFNALGESFFASGFNWFSLINTRLSIVGRSLRSVPPVLSVPSPPTISLLELPFLDAQLAKIVYPSGEFSAPHDVVIFLAQANSIGRIVRPSTPKLMLASQFPGDTETSFQIPWLETYGFVGEDSKGFGEIHAQTTDGRRSAPTALTFIKSDAAAYTTTALEYNGTTQFSTRAAALTGVFDSKQCTFSFWLRHNTAAGTSAIILRNNGLRIDLFMASDNTIVLRLRDSAGLLIVDISSSAPIPADSTWHSFIFSADTALSRYQLFIDGIDDSPSIVETNPNLAVEFSQNLWSYAATTLGTLFTAACFSEIWMDITTAFDLTDPLNIARFISPEGAPMDLGNQAHFPTAVPAIIYFRGGDPTTNTGTGGVFINVGAPGACGTSP